MSLSNNGSRTPLMPSQKDSTPLFLRAAVLMKKSKTYSSGYSHVVTHRSTSPPVRSLSTGERTGSSVFCDLWPYVLFPRHH